MVAVYRQRENEIGRRPSNGEGKSSSSHDKCVMHDQTINENQYAGARHMAHGDKN